jgi:photosystem II stability/assembly factor-like uncharacterized protein
MVDANNGWSLTTKHAILKTSDGGNHWQDVTPEAQTPGLNVQGEFLTAQTAWIAWQSAQGLQGQKQSITILHTSDGGTNWQVTIINNAAGSMVDPPRFINTQEGWIVTFQLEGMYHSLINTYRTIDGGQTWTNISGPVQTTEVTNNTGISFSNAQLGWAGLERPGPPMIEKTEDGGHSWQAQSLPAPASEMAQTTAAVLIGANGLLPIHIPDSGSPQSRLDIYTTHNAGATWTAGAVANFDSNDVYALDAQHVWAEETNSNALHFSSDGGKTWVQLVQTPDHFDALSFVDTSNGWAIDDAGRLYRTTNGGTNWQLLST